MDMRTTLHTVYTRRVYTVCVGRGGMNNCAGEGAGNSCHHGSENRRTPVPRLPVAVTVRRPTERSSTPRRRCARRCCRPRTWLPSVSARASFAWEYAHRSTCQLSAVRPDHPASRPHTAQPTRLRQPPIAVNGRRYLDGVLRAPPTRAGGQKPKNALLAGRASLCGTPWPSRVAT